MTRECKQVMDVCGFEKTRENIVIIETFLTCVSPNFFIKLVERYDPDGKYDNPDAFFEYIKNKKANIICTMDNLFWQCYDLFDLLGDDLRVFHFPAIDWMKNDIPTVKAALYNSRIKTVPYISAVLHKDTYTQRTIENNLDKVDIPIIYQNVETRGGIS